MNQIKELDIVQISSGKKSKKKDSVIKEIPFTIQINGKEIVTLLCSHDKLEYLAAGYLLSEGLVSKDTVIEDVVVGKDGYYANVKLNKDFEIPQDFFKKRLISSGCGRGVSFYGSNEVVDCEPVDSDIQIGRKQIMGLMKEFQGESVLFKETGGVHSAALCKSDQQGRSIPSLCHCEPEGRGNLIKIDVFAEDIGRHNAVDKLFGECFFKKVSTENKIILTSGRISSEILIKVIRQKIPIIISRAAPTDLAVALAEKMKITLLGFVRGGRMNIYTHNFRIKL